MNKKNWVLGITLFSMFFGAGNLIFAPYMGAQAGSQTIWALPGFVCTAVLLPIAAIITIAPYGSAQAMISRIWKPLGVIFVTIIYLLIGPCIAIPRTASTSFEMWTWLIGSGLNARILYTLIFFGASALLALYPGKLRTILGRILGPLLLLLVGFVCIPMLFRISAPVAPTDPWAQGAFVKGLNEGYQTMDILAAFCFGLIFMLNIRQAGAANEKKTFLISACIAGGLLAAVYALLAMSAMFQSGTLQACSNGAEILSVMAGSVWGSAGQLLCGLIFLLACLNVCTGLIASCSEYFSLQFPNVSYRIWLVLFTLAGAGASCLGLDSILAWSGTILSWICPIAVLLLITGWIHRPKQAVESADDSSVSAAASQEQTARSSI